MAIPRSFKYSFQKSPQKSYKTISDFSSGMNTRDAETSVLIREAKNVIFETGSGFETRPGNTQKGNQIGTSAISGLHSYVKKNGTAQLLASWNTGIYYFSESASTPSAVATSTATRPLSYSKDRTVFLTSKNNDASGDPYTVVLYQNGSGIQLEWSASPYTSWSTTPITITTSTTDQFSAVMDENDNIYVIYINSATNLYEVNKLTYATGPTWTLGTATNSYSSGVHSFPTIGYYRNTATSGAYFYIAFQVFAGGVYRTAFTSSNDGSFPNFSSIVKFLDTASANQRYPMIVNNPGFSFGNLSAYVLIQNVSSLTITQYSFPCDSLTSTPVLTATNTYASMTIGEFTGYRTAGGVAVVNDTVGLGYQVTNISTDAGGSRNDYSVAVDGATDRDIQLTQTVSGSTQATTRITTGTSNNIHPRSPEIVTGNTAYVPVVFRTGTSSPYTINIVNFNQWISTSTTITAGGKVNSCTMPLTAAGGTNQHYFVNGINVPRKWNGTTMTASTSTSQPIPTFIFAMDNRLLMDDVTTGALYYTNLGNDNFTGTFPTTNRVDFPEKPVWGHFYRDRIALIFTNNGVYTMNNFDYTGQSVGPEQLRKVPDSYGTLSGRTVKQIGYWVYYQRPDGQVMRTNGQYAELCSDIIFPSLQSLNTGQLINAVAGVKDQQYFLSITASASAQNNIRWRLDTRKAPNGGWSYDTGIFPGCFTEHVTNTGSPTLFFADARSTIGKVYEVDTGTNDAGNPIELDLQTGAMPFSGITYNDRLRDLLIIADATGDYTPTLGIAKLENLNLFTNKTFSVANDFPIWGSFTWGSFVWGGKTNIERNILNINLISRAFKFRIRHNVLNQRISVLSITPKYEPVVDTP